MSPEAPPFARSKKANLSPVPFCTVHVFTFHVFTFSPSRFPRIGLRPLDRLEPQALADHPPQLVKLLLRRQ
jgi:hypothetical protein